MNSLREELGGGGPAVPDFRFVLPPGWTTYDTTERTEKELLAKARERLRQTHRPDVYAILAGHVERALAAARKQGAFMMIMAGDEAPPWSTVPVSVLASVTQATSEVSLDRMVADAIERRGARALDGSRHFLRWADERTVSLTGETLGAHTVVYLTPVPATNRRKALQLTATLAHPVDVDPTTDPQMAAWLELLDGCIATFAWTGE